jgi:hypothetical protein
MPTPNGQRRRGLELLASSTDGCTEGLSRMDLRSNCCSTWSEPARDRARRAHDGRRTPNAAHPGPDHGRRAARNRVARQVSPAMAQLILKRASASTSSRTAPSLSLDRLHCSPFGFSAVQSGPLRVVLNIPFAGRRCGIPDGQIVLLTHLRAGQRATILQSCWRAYQTRAAHIQIPKKKSQIED